MKRDKSLGIKKFRSICILSALEMIMGILFTGIDVMVVGNIVGDDGLSAMSIITPLLTLSFFTEAFFSTGTSFVCAGYIGEYKTDEAEKAFGTGVIFSMITGCLFCLLLYFGLPLYMDYLGVSDKIRTLVNSYMIFVYFSIMLEPSYRLICNLLYLDGDEMLGATSNIVAPVVNVVFSVILGLRMGIKGIGLGTLISLMSGFSILVIHFFKKKTTLHPSFGIVWKDVRQMILFGANDSLVFLLMPVTASIINKLIVLNFGEKYLPVFTILNLVIELTFVFETSCEAMKPILPIYRGDGNISGIKRIMICAIKMNLIFMTILSFALIVLAGSINDLFDINNMELYSLCKHGIKICTLSFPALSILSVFNSFFLNTGHRYLSVLESVLHYFLTEIVVIPVCFGLFGINGLWIGFVISFYVSAIIYFTIIYLKFGKKLFPLLLEPDSAVYENKSFPVDNEHIVEYISRTDDFLRKNNVSSKTASKVVLVIEECLTYIMNQNSGKKLEAECFIKTDGVNVDLTIWDNGKFFDIMQADNKLVSFQSYIVSRIIDTVQVKKHMEAAGFNRNTFYFAG